MKSATRKIITFNAGQSLLACVIAVGVQASAVGAGSVFRANFGEVADIGLGGEILYANVLRAGSQDTTLNAFGGVTSAVSISNDGKVIAGNGTTSTTQFYRGWIKRGDGPYVDIGTIGPGQDRTYVAAMSKDGNFITGVSYNPQSTYQGFRWSQSTGMQPIPFLPHSISVSNSGISADGSVVAGTATIVDDSYDPGFINYDCAGICAPPVARYDQAYMWTEAGGSVLLGSLQDPPAPSLGNRPHVPYSTYVTAISGDGKTIVGYTTGPTLSGFIWRADTGMQALPELPGLQQLFFPLAVSGDGSTVVGMVGGSCGTDCFSGPGAVIWDATHGTRLLEDVLKNEYDLGTQIGSWFLRSATFISGDGLTIAGEAAPVNRLYSGWIATLAPAQVPEPACVLLMLAGAFLMSASFRTRSVS